MRIDPGFPAFLEFCRRRGAEVKIVSDGFDRVVGAALRSARLSVPFFANKLEWQGGDRWRLAFPHAQTTVAWEAPIASARTAQRPLPGPQVVIGDGRSDFCMSMRADYVIAKGTLADYCRARGHAHASFADFDEVTARLSAWLAGAETCRPAPCRDSCSRRLPAP